MSVLRCSRLILPSILVFSIPGVSPARALEVWPDLSSIPSGQGGGGKDAAVVVGVENYPFIRKAAYPAWNADNWEEYLTETINVPPGKMASLRNNEATVEEMRKYAASKASEVAAGGTLWFTFTGRGVPSEDGKDALLAGVDAQLKTESLYARSLSLAELLGILAKGRQAKTILLVDICYSGSSPSGTSLVRSVQPFVPKYILPKKIDEKTLLLMKEVEPEQQAPRLTGADRSRPVFTFLHSRPCVDEKPKAPSDSRPPLEALRSQPAAPSGGDPASIPPSAPAPTGSPTPILPVPQPGQGNRGAEARGRGACLIRNSGISIPMSIDPDTGKGYARAFLGHHTLDELRGLCTPAIYQELILSYTGAGNDKPVTREIVLYSQENGAFLGSSAPNIGVGPVGVAVHP